MKILLLSEYIDGYKRESAFTVRYLTAKALSELGHDVTFMYPSRSIGFRNVIAKADNLTTIATPGLLPPKFRKGGFGLLDALWKSWHVLFGKFNVIHVTSGHRPAHLVCCLVAKCLKKSIIIDEWWEWFGIDGIGAMRKGLYGKTICFFDALFELPSKRFYDGVVAISSVLKTRLKRNDNVVVIHGGAETNSIDYYDISTARDQLGLSLRLFVVGMSNFAEEDLGDNIIFLDAFARLAKEYDHIRLFVTGEESFVREFFSATAYEDKVIFPGWLTFDDYSRYLCACSVFVLPFRNTIRNAGRWPNKIGDYLCANRPIISNRTGDIGDLFDSFKIGFTCDDTSEGFYSVLKPLINEGTDQTEHCIDSGYVSTEILSFDKRVRSIVEFYEHCLRRGKSKVR